MPSTSHSERTPKPIKSCKRLRKEKKAKKGTKLLPTPENYYLRQAIKAERDYQNQARAFQEHMFIFMNLTEKPSVAEFLWYMGNSITLALEATAFRIYKIIHKDDDYSIKVFSYEEPAETPTQEDTIPDTDLSEVIRTGTCMYFSRDEPVQDDSSLVKADEDSSELNCCMLVPLLDLDGKATHVIEVWKIIVFNEADRQTTCNFITWGSLALYFCEKMGKKKMTSHLTNFLLDTVKAIFEEMVSLDDVIKHILEFAQELVDADRASLFLVDEQNNELVSTVFDLKLQGKASKEKKEIRIPVTSGIAGHVAMTGEYVNITDAYSDARFNRDVDEATGYQTKSILCMPIKVAGQIIGVVQMVNKLDKDKFGSRDEKSFNIFATFFGLALHHARLYDTIARKEQKYKVALEVLSYHSTCRDADVEEMLAMEPHHVSFDLIDFYLDPFALSSFEKCQTTLIMFDDLFKMKNFDRSSLTRFILTVKKNYREVPYHNFHHGWSVAQTMYTILKHDDSLHFRYIQRLALFVASLCHDLDHRGYTNQYMNETASPLAAMYGTSTLEHHHFNTTITILQQDGHNIFSRFSTAEYKEILGLIRTCILATDLAAFFPNLAKMKKLCSEEVLTYDWDNVQHGELAMAMSMTAADLSASAKPWDIQIKTVKVIFEEFYDQGDKERAAGRTPIPMMDRTKPEHQSTSQIEFITNMCLPCYEILQIILPNTRDMYVMASKNLNKWARQAEIDNQVSNASNTDEHPTEREMYFRESTSPDTVVENSIRTDDSEIGYILTDAEVRMFNIVDIDTSNIRRCPTTSNPSLDKSTLI